MLDTKLMAILSAISKYPLRGNRKRVNKYPGQNKSKSNPRGNFRKGITLQQTDKKTNSIRIKNICPLISISHIELACFNSFIANYLSAEAFILYISAVPEL